MKVKKIKEFKVNENANKPKLVTKAPYGGKNILIFYIKNSPFDNYFYAEDDFGDNFVDISTKLPGNDLMDAIWVKDGEHEEVLAEMLVDNNILTRTKVTTTNGNGMNTYRKYDII